MFTIRTARSEGAPIDNYSLVFKASPVERLARLGFENAEQVSAAIIGEGSVIVAAGHAFRSAQDAPNKLLGYELALGRALKKFTANKSVRAKFWEAFNRANSVENPLRVQLRAAEENLRDSEAAHDGDPEWPVAECTVCANLRRRVEELRAQLGDTR